MDQALCEKLGRFWLRQNLGKQEYMAKFWANEELGSTVWSANQRLYKLQDFGMEGKPLRDLVYLGGIFNHDGSNRPEIQKRIEAAQQACVAAAASGHDQVLEFLLDMSEVDVNRQDTLTGETG